MVMAVVLVVLVVGSVLFHYLSPWYFLPIASNWGTIDDTVSITFWVTGFVFVVVNLFMAWCVLRYRNGKTNPVTQNVIETVSSIVPQLDAIGRKYHGLK